MLNQTKKMAIGRSVARHELSLGDLRRSPRRLCQGNWGDVMIAVLFIVLAFAVVATLLTNDWWG